MPLIPTVPLGVNTIFEPALACVKGSGLAESVFCFALPVRTYLRRLVAHRADREGLGKCVLSFRANSTSTPIPLLGLCGYSEEDAE